VLGVPNFLKTEGFEGVTKFTVETYNNSDTLGVVVKGTTQNRREKNMWKVYKDEFIYKWCYSKEEALAYVLKLKAVKDLHIAYEEQGA
jgi:hypothetical protein